MKKYRVLLVAFLMAFTIPQALGSGVSFPSTYHANAVAITGGTIINTRLGGMSAITNSLTSDVALNNTALYFDGPSVAQGTVGTWFVMGEFCYKAGVAGATVYYRMWDGTTIISSGAFIEGTGTVVNSITCFSLSGIISNPTGNIKISVQDSYSTLSLITFNTGAVGKNSTISAIRID
jgi:hypothetical protein